MRAAREAADRAARERAAREERERRLSILSAPIHFALDRSDLETAARTTLDAKLSLLRESPSVQLRIEGHADERGSTEYNLALGMRRAAAARRYLVQRGIDASRVEITSFGEERPVCQLSEESCWARNRRAEFAPSGL